MPEEYGRNQKHGLARDQQSWLFHNILEANKRERICYIFTMSEFARQKARVCFLTSLPYGVLSSSFIKLP
jgi:hypothetical protein